jgi:branched-chain amino acid transport system permease protein
VWTPTLVAVAVLVVALLPLVVSSSYYLFVVSIGVIYAVIASNWDLTLGFAGIFNLAHTAFFALGAYAAGIVTTTWSLSPWLGLPCGAATAAVAALVVYLPTARLRGINTALVTFLFSQLALHLVLSESKYTGGSYGIVGIPPLTIGGYSFISGRQLGYYYTALIVFVVSTVFLRSVVRSNYGLSIMALRDFEQLAKSRGISPARQQMLAFLLSSIFTGLAGALYAIYIGVVSPELFGFGFISLFLSMVLVGGIGTIYGPIVGAALITAVSQPLQQYGPWEFVVIALIIIGTMWLVPAGIVGVLRGDRESGGALIIRRLLRRQEAQARAAFPVPPALGGAGWASGDPGDTPRA